MLQLVKQTINAIQEKELLSVDEIEKAKLLYNQYDHIILSQGREKITALIENENEEEIVVEIITEDDIDLYSKINGHFAEWEVSSLVALYLIEETLSKETLSEGLKYTREGMRRRVLEEREDRAKKADYKVKLATNLYGEHTLINEKGKTYTITLRDFENKTGYINNIDWKTNKLGTTKHILFLFKYLEENPNKKNRLTKKYPFIEIYTDPLNDYKITWYFPDALEEDEQQLLDSYFGNNHHIENSKIALFFSFIHASRDFHRIKIRKEVFEKIENFFENNELQQIEKQSVLDYSSINATLYPYQKEGVAFSVFKKGVIIADEMGLGKTIQAIATAVLKKDIFDFKKVLVIYFRIEVFAIFNEP